ncbi:MAG TPA: hypothetical protein DCF89_11180 [Flavobacteriales bacterium]|nr:hypothetical protein [Crocinitomicaceae bacterium]HAE31667.1 hypothetical protein [Flavobacteriales bacterium]|tara:strand:- start:147 stop:569 length:423 start_codon:yes stop_codon:yes gene_type:complete
MPTTAKSYSYIPPAIVSGSVYLFTTESGLEYEVRFARKRNNLLHCTIAFGVLNEEYEGEEYVVVNKGEVFRVMATIVDIVKKYIEEHPNVRSFEYSGEPTGKETENRPSKRMNLYDRYLPAIFGTSWSFNRKGNKMIITR